LIFINFPRQVEQYILHEIEFRTGLEKSFQPLLRCDMEFRATRLVIASSTSESRLRIARCSGFLYKSEGRRFEIGASGSAK